MGLGLGSGWVRGAGWQHRSLERLLLDEHLLQRALQVRLRRRLPLRLLPLRLLPLRRLPLRRLPLQLLLRPVPGLARLPPRLDPAVPPHPPPVLLTLLHALSLSLL